MKIFFLVNSLSFGGTERTVAYLSSYLAEHGEDVVLYTITDAVKYTINPKIKVICGNLSTGYGSRLEKYINIIRRVIAINRAIRIERPDIIFCMIANIAKYLIGNRKRKYKLVVSERSNPKYLPQTEYELEKKIFKRADGIVLQTERVKENYQGLIEGKCTVIPNAVGNENVYDTSWKPNGRKSIAAIGRLAAEKDYLVMLEAFQRFLSSHPGFELEIYGSGDEKEAIERYIALKGLEDAVILRGVCTDAINKIADARCYVLTSIYEGMPNTLMEAMAIGMPCVATDCEYGPAELIQDGENGLLVPVGDAEAISKAMCRMVDDKEFTKRCGESAKRILETNSVEKICSKYWKFLKEVNEKGML